MSNLHNISHHIVQVDWESGGLLQTVRATPSFHGTEWFDSGAVGVEGQVEPVYCQFRCFFTIKLQGYDEDESSRRRYQMRTEKEVDADESGQMFALVRYYRPGDGRAHDLLHDDGNIRLEWKVRRPGAVSGRRRHYQQIAEPGLQAAQDKGYAVIPMACVIRHVYVTPDFAQGDGNFHLSKCRWAGGTTDSRTVAQLEGARYNMGYITNR